MHVKWIYVVDTPTLPTRFFYTINGILCYMKTDPVLGEGYTVAVDEAKLITALNGHLIAVFNASKPTEYKVVCEMNAKGKRVRRKVEWPYKTLYFRVTRIEKGPERTW